MAFVGFVFMGLGLVGALASAVNRRSKRPPSPLHFDVSWRSWTWFFIAVAALGLVLVTAAFL